MIRRIPGLALSVCAFALTGTAALAQSAPPAETTEAQHSGGLQDIVVTAQRREERLQDVPISVNVVGGERLTQAGLGLSLDLPSIVPALNFATTGIAGTPFLRGIGSNAANPNDEASVATYVDGVYIASPQANILNLANLKRVEVLKGPQGTLFGRNATGGVIQFVTRDPSFKPVMEVAAGYANYDTISGSVYASTGLTDTLAVDFTAQGQDQRKGWGYNAIRNEETYLASNYSFRSKVLFQPSEDFRMTLAGDYSSFTANWPDDRLPFGAIGADGLPSSPNGYDTRGTILSVPGLDNTPLVKSKQYGVSLNTSGDMGFATLVTILAYRHVKGEYHAEADATPISLVEADLQTAQHNISGEVQLIGRKDDRFNWTLGAYYFDSTAGYSDITFVVPAVPVPIISSTFQNTKSVSGYAQASLVVLPRLTLTAGIRYTDERESMQGNVGLAVFLPRFPVTGAERGYREFTYRAAIDYGFTDDVHGYASFNRGVKGGGFDILSIFGALSGDPLTSFDPEFLDAYEVGLKSTLFNRTLRFNAAAFYYDYKNIQVQVIPAGSTSASVATTTNAAAATVKGIDIDFEWRPVAGLSLSGGGAYIKGRYDNFKNTIAYGLSANQVTAPFDASGKPTIRTPKFTANLTAAYTFDAKFGSVTPSVTVSHNSGFSFDSANVLRNEAYTLVNASLNITTADQRYGVRFWGSNLTKEYYYNSGVPSAFGARTVPAAPRTYGVTLSAKFGG